MDGWIVGVYGVLYVNYFIAACPVLYSQVCTVLYSTYRYLPCNRLRPTRCPTGYKRGMPWRNHMRQTFCVQGRRQGKISDLAVDLLLELRAMGPRGREAVSRTALGRSWLAVRVGLGFQSRAFSAPGLRVSFHLAVADCLCCVGAF